MAATNVQTTPLSVIVSLALGLVEPNSMAPDANPAPLNAIESPG